MDNITHTLIGAMIGDVADRSVPADAAGLPARTRRTLGVGLMIVGSNLPDADFLYSAVTGSKLDYLLQHRGHTHTIVGALLLAAAVAGCLAGWLKHRRIPWSGRDARYLFAIALLAPLLHIGLDFTNSYGVHPFWPVRNDWFYGDAVFIVEPLLWATATPLLFTLHTRSARVLVALALAAGIALSFASGLVPAALAGALTALVVVLAGIAATSSPRRALAAGVLAWFGVTSLFFVSGAVATTRLEGLLAVAFPQATTIDNVLTPMPVNPVCREVLAVQTEGSRYLVRKATLSLLPGWLPAGDCPQRVMGSASTAPLTAVPAASTAELHWHGEFAMERDRIGDLARQFCAARAMFQFARVPWAMPTGSNWIIGDLRYDREPELGLAEIETGPTEDPCPRRIPPWIPPRAALFDAAGD